MPGKQQRTPRWPNAFDTWSRGFVAMVGGYVLSSAAAVVLADTIPFSAVEATVSSSLLSIVVFVCAVLWAFVARTGLYAWLGIMVPAALLILIESVRQ